VAHLISSSKHDDVFAYFILENVVDYTLRIKMGELYGESLEGVALWHVVFD